MAVQLPRWLDTPPPGWFETTDVLVVGSGVAGLSAALHARRAGHRVVVVTKQGVGEGSTWWAQGGVAAALGPGDTPEQHLHDTLDAGGGLCDPRAVGILVAEGPSRVLELVGLGADFDRAPDGELALGREGGHRRRRIAHAGGDATGAEIQRVLAAAVLADRGIRLVEHALALDLLTDASGRAVGVTVHVLGEGLPDGVGAVLAGAVVLASGGLGQVYAATTNPDVATGDGLALALRAGAVVADIEFVQFHPTALRLGDGGAGHQVPLVTEALRGEGARLRDVAGRSVTEGVHAMGDLAPRDVVTRAIAASMARTGADHVLLDARGLGGDALRAKFPTVTASCLAAGLDPAMEPIPVAPAAHYVSGGVVTDGLGRTSIPGLYACGEVACTGVHGANRLASNSLLEGLVFAERIGRCVADPLPPPGEPVELPPARPAGGPGCQDPAVRSELGRAMTAGAGVLRTGEGLAVLADRLANLAGRRGAARDAAGWETANMLTAARAVTAAASARRESRGSHARADHPETDPAWLGRVLVRRDAAGEQSVRFDPRETT